MGKHFIILDYIREENIREKMHIKWITESREIFFGPNIISNYQIIMYILRF